MYCGKPVQKRLLKSNTIGVRKRGIVMTQLGRLPLVPTAIAEPRERKLCARGAETNPKLTRSAVSRVSETKSDNLLSWYCMRARI